MENTVAYFGLKDEDDFMYKKGEAKAEIRLQEQLAAQRAEAQRERDEVQKRLELNQRFTVIQMLDIGTLTDDQIIKVSDATAAFIVKVKKDLAAAPSRIARLKKTASAEKIAQQLNLPINWVEKQMPQV